MTPQSLDNPIYRCVIEQLSSVETYLEHWKRPENRKIEDIEWLIMHVATGKQPKQFHSTLLNKSLSKQVVMEALSAINTEISRAKMQGLGLQRLTYEVIALGLLQYLLRKGMEVPKEVVSNYKQTLDAAAEALTGEQIHVFN